MDQENVIAGSCIIVAIIKLLLFLNDYESCDTKSKFGICYDRCCCEVIDTAWIIGVGWH